MLAVVLLVVVVVGVRFVVSQISANESAVRPQRTNVYSPVACNPSMLEANITSSGGTAGQPVSFEITLHNKSADNPCYVDVGWSNLNVDITSGSAKTASLAACKQGAENKRLLLDRDYTATVKTTWFGGVGGDGCGDAATNPAGAGTYVATLSFGDGAAGEATQSFVLQ